MQGVKVWCDGKEYMPHSADGGGSDNEVLLPFARDESNTALVVSAQLPGTAAAGGGKDCVMLFKDFRYAIHTHQHHCVQPEMGACGYIHSWQAWRMQPPTPQHCPLFPPTTVCAGV